MTTSRTGTSSDREARALGVLADGIIPGDERDAGAAAVDAGPRLAHRMQNGMHAAVYAEGLCAAERAALEIFARPLTELTSAQVAAVLDRLVTVAPRFFRQLRGDVAALYLSDPGVCARIGFPGPSLVTGGYPDFDQPQTDAGGRTTGE